VSWIPACFKVHAIQLCVKNMPVASSTNKADHYDVSGLQQVGSSLGTLVSSTNKIYHYDISEK
jgi:hypothetical protein